LEETESTTLQNERACSIGNQFPRQNSQCSISVVTTPILELCFQHFNGKKAFISCDRCFQVQLSSHHYTPCKISSKIKCCKNI
uniref:Ovule protein n=1 Tax=Brugia timori TaxID=42155 RepID=A0A0R3RBF7_9BILA